MSAEAIDLGLSSYYFVGLMLGVFWAGEAARSPTNEYGPAVLVMAVMLMMLIWPAMLVWLWDSEDRWRR